MIEGAFIAVAVVGLLHGLEPGHGWPIAVLYSIRSRRPTLMALVSSSVISIFHLVSSVAVVVAYVLLMNFLSFSLPYVNYLAGLGLAVLGIRCLTEKPKDGEQENHEHFHEDFGPGSTPTSMNIPDSTNTHTRISTAVVSYCHCPASP